MRSTRATAALARLNARSDGRSYVMILTGSGRFRLGEGLVSGDNSISDPLTLDDFVALADSLGLQKTQRVTKTEASFLRQLATKVRID